MTLRDALINALSREDQAIVVAVTETHGSTPRDAGAAMIVTQSCAQGTIGGGEVEHNAIAQARDMIAGQAPPCQRDYTLGAGNDQCCGGRMHVAFSLFTASDAPMLRAQDGPLHLWRHGPVVRPDDEPRPVYLYGAGHVGRALVGALAPLPFRVRWIDARADAFKDTPPVAETVETPLPEAQVWAAPVDTFHIVVTHSHALDLEIVTSVLDRGRFGFLGLIGSATKRERFVRRLRERGLHPAPLVCPIGLGGLQDKRPEVIAAMTAAQLLEHDLRLRQRMPDTLWRPQAIGAS